MSTDVYHREHLFTNVCRPKHAQNVWSRGCHFGVAWKKILIECVQARQGQLGLQIWITLQVNYFRLQVNGQIRGAYCEKASKRLGSPSQVGQKSGTVSWTPATTLLLYWFKSLLSPVARTLFRQRKWAVSSPVSCVSHKDNFNLNARMVS